MWPWFLVLFLLVRVEAACVPRSGCEVAYAYYKAQANETLDSIGAKFQVTADGILAVNPSIATTQDLLADQPLYIPFKCECLQNDLYQTFNYQVQRTDDIEWITSTIYEDLTQKDWVATWNAINEPSFILTDSILKIPVRCSCGDPLVSLSYGLFATYVVEAGDNPSTVAANFNTTEAVVTRYNPSVNWNSSSSTAQYAFIPVTDNTSHYPEYSFGSTDAGNGITTAGIVIGVAIGVGGALGFLSLLYVCRYYADETQRRQRERLQLEIKLKNLEANPISSDLKMHS